MCFGTNYCPDGIVDGKSLFEIVTTPSPPADHDYPFQGLGKSVRSDMESLSQSLQDLVSVNPASVELATNLLSKGERVGYLALEESNRRTALGLMSAHVGKSLHLGEHSHWSCSGI